MNKNLEIKLYEKLGVIHFKKVPLKIMDSLEKITGQKNFHKKASNYYLKSSNIEDIKEFRKWLIVNGTIHVFALTQNAISIFDNMKLNSNPSTNIVLGIIALINTYCIMLQRYNWIRIKSTIEKYDKTKKLKQEKLINKNEDNNAQEKLQSLLIDYDGKLPHLLSSMQIEFNDKEIAPLLPQQSYEESTNKSL